MLKLSIVRNNESAEKQQQALDGMCSFDSIDEVKNQLKILSNAGPFYPTTEGLP